MRRWHFICLIGLLAGFAAGAPASAQTASGASSTERTETRPRSRPRIVIHSRRTELGPNAKRQCRSWLAQEYRVSGTVIVPKMECWWQ